MRLFYKCCICPPGFFIICFAIFFCRSYSFCYFFFRVFVIFCMYCMYIVYNFFFFSHQILAVFSCPSHIAHVFLISDCTILFLLLIYRTSPASYKISFFSVSFLIVFPNTIWKMKHSGKAKETHIESLLYNMFFIFVSDIVESQ